MSVSGQRNGSQPGVDGDAALRVGLMSAAHVHFDGYASLLKERRDVEVVGITDEDAERGQAAAARYGWPWVPDPEALVSKATALVITAENVRHRHYGELAARAGRAILCEKPLATTLADATALVAAAREGGARLFTALPVRGVPAVGRLRHLVASGRLGTVLAMAGTNHGQLPPGWFLQPDLSGGGALMDHVSHVADIMRWVLNDEVGTVYAQATNRLYDQAVEDCALVHMTFKRTGVVATLDPSWSRPPSFPSWGDVYLEVVGTAGVAQLDPWADHLDWYPAEPAAHRVRGYGPDMDALMVSRFLTAARGGPVAPELATGEDGCAVTAITVAAYESLRSGQPAAVRG